MVVPHPIARTYASSLSEMGGRVTNRRPRMPPSALTRGGRAPTARSSKTSPRRPLPPPRSSQSCTRSHVRHSRMYWQAAVEHTAMRHAAKSDHRPLPHHAHHLAVRPLHLHPRRSYRLPRSARLHSRYSPVGRWPDITRTTTSEARRGPCTCPLAPILKLATATRWPSQSLLDPPWAAAAASGRASQS